MVDYDGLSIVILTEIVGLSVSNVTCKYINKRHCTLGIGKVDTSVNLQCKERQHQERHDEAIDLAS